MNKTIIMGRLTNDPETRHTTSGKTVCHFRLAVNRRYAKKGEQEQADFFPIIAWEKVGDFCNNHFRKGQQVSVIGRLQNRSWNDDKGNKRMVTEIIAEEVFFADSKKDNNSLPSSEENIIDGYQAEDSECELPF